MKRKIHLFLLAICVSITGTWAQKRLSKEEFRSKQQAFITEQAELSAEEAAQFFPLYFELQDKKNAHNKEAWQKIRKGRTSDVSETEYGKIVEDVIKARIASDELDLEYVRKYKKFLSAKKIYQIQRAEMRFHRELLKITKKNKGKQNIH